MKLESNSEFEKHPIRIQYDDERPITSYDSLKNAHAYCFNKRGELLICKKPGEDWSIPGGKIESGESIEEALRREIDEEVSITIKNIEYIGTVHIDWLDGFKSSVQMARFFALIDKEKEITIDPATKSIWERKYIQPNEFSKYVKWDKIGQYMADNAELLFKNLKK